MSFFLSKFLPLLVLPIGITLILLGVGIVTRRRTWLTAAAAVLWVSSTPLMAAALTGFVEGQATRGRAGAASPVDAIVVLSTGRTLAPGPEAVSEWTDADRFFAGVELFQAGKAAILVFTGGWSPTEPVGPLEGDVLADYAVRMNIPRYQVLTTGRVRNTSEEAAAVSALLKARQTDVPRILLVTSAFHMPRARLLFERAGLAVSEFPVDFAGSGGGPVGVMSFVPTAGALAQTQVAMRELFGRLYYRLVSS